MKFLKPQDVTYHQQYFKFKPHDSFGGESEVVEPTVVEPTVVEAILLGGSGGATGIGNDITGDGENLPLLLLQLTLFYNNNHHIQN